MSTGYETELSPGERTRSGLELLLYNLAKDQPWFIDTRPGVTLLVKVGFKAAAEGFLIDNELEGVTVEESKPPVKLLFLG